MGLQDIRRRLPVVAALPAPDNRRILPDRRGDPPTPRYCVWELTLAWMIAGTACGPQVIVGDDAVASTDVTETGAPAIETSAATTGVPPVTTTTTTATTSLPDDDTTSARVDDDSGSATWDPTCAFLCPADGGGSFECSTIAQDCPPGEKCMPWANDGGSVWNATRCSPIARDPSQVGELCMVEGSATSGIDDCDIGLMCWLVDETGVGMCEDMCTGSPDNPVCEDPEDACIVAFEGAVALCDEICHPIVQTCAVDNEVCHAFGDGFFCCPDHSGELGAYGDPCWGDCFCDEGNVCIAAASFTFCPDEASCCSSFCDVTDPNADAACQAMDPNQTCEPWYLPGNAPAGYANVGVCMIAAGG